MGGKISKKTDSPSNPDASKRNSKRASKIPKSMLNNNSPENADNPSKQGLNETKNGPESAKPQPSSSKPTATDRTSSTNTSANDASISKGEDLGDELVQLMSKVRKLILIWYKKNFGS